MTDSISHMAESPRGMGDHHQSLPRMSEHHHPHQHHHHRLSDTPVHSQQSHQSQQSHHHQNHPSHRISEHIHQSRGLPDHHSQSPRLSDSHHQSQSQSQSQIRQAIAELQQSRIVEPQQSRISEQVHRLSEAQQARISDLQARISDQQNRISDQQSRIVEHQQARISEQAQLRAEQQQARLAEQQQARLAEQQQARLAEQQQARIAEQQQARIAEQQAARLAEQQQTRIAEQQAARIAEQQAARIIEQQQARIAEQNRISEQQLRAEQQQARIVEQQAARLAEQQQIRVVEQSRLSDRVAEPQTRIVEPQGQGGRMSEHQSRITEHQQRLAESQLSDSATSAPPSNAPITPTPSDGEGGLDSFSDNSDDDMSMSVSVSMSRSPSPVEMKPDISFDLNNLNNLNNLNLIGPLGTEVRPTPPKNRPARNKQMTLREKLEALKYLESHSVNATARAYGVHPRSIRDWRQSRAMIEATVQQEELLALEQGRVEDGAPTPLRKRIPGAGRKKQDKVIVEISDQNPNKRHRRSIKLHDKVEIIRLIENGQTQSDVARSLGISQSTVQTIWSNKQEILERNSHPRKKRKNLHWKKYSSIDQSLFTWYRQCKESGVPVDGKMLLDKATEFAEYFKQPDFKGQAIRWVDMFKKRHSISEIDRQDRLQAAAAAAAEQAQQHLQGQLAGAGLAGGSAHDLVPEFDLSSFPGLMAGLYPPDPTNPSGAPPASASGLPALNFNPHIPIMVTMPVTTCDAMKYVELIRSWLTNSFGDTEETLNNHLNAIENAILKRRMTEMLAPGSQR